MTEQAFLEQIRANQGIIYKLVGLYAYDAEEKKDLYQEVLLQTWKSLDSFRGEAKFSTWLYRICLNTILTQKRKNSRIDFKESLEDLPVSVKNISEEKQDTIRLQQAIRKLAETDRAIISMHLDGYDNPEIAEVMGISNNHVAVKLHRIKQQLANLLNP
ncbi:MAG: sigma-70 family RNA polymerase sigma factor [Chitinophagaceae bacterium]|nr:sigma-70 family RNA polymerase sigma factor [Chitinophagaceae bacterium]